jgi:hypothetical protein
LSETNGNDVYFFLLHAGDLTSCGQAQIRIAARLATTYLVCRRTELPGAYRQFVLDATNAEAEFFAVANEAFPNIILHPTVTFRKLSKGYAAIVSNVVDHLSFLSDDFIAIGRQENWDLPRMMRIARISFSEESGKTRGQEKLLKLRRVYFGERMVECTLHTKISPRADRIHFHAPVPEIDPNKVLVGIFVAHLPT